MHVHDGCSWPGLWLYSTCASEAFRDASAVTVFCVWMGALKQKVSTDGH